MVAVTKYVALKDYSEADLDDLSEEERTAMFASADFNYWDYACECPFCGSDILVVYNDDPCSPAVVSMKCKHLKKVAKCLNNECTKLPDDVDWEGENYNIADDELENYTYSGEPKAVFEYVEDDSKSGLKDILLGST